MEKGLLIAEKPSLMREIQSAFRQFGGSAHYGFDLDFMAQAGHLVGLKMPEEFDEKYKHWAINNYPLPIRFEYRPLEGKTNLVKDINAAVHSGKYSFVVHAGDPDGEGELLVQLVLKYVGNTLPVRRFWSNDITPKAIDKALLSMKDDSVYKPIYLAALVRQHEDYQAGLNLTGVCTLKSHSESTVRLGRIKAALLRLIVDRSREVRNWVDSSRFRRMFDYKGCEFVNEKEFATDLDALHACPKCDSATVTTAKEETKPKKAPRLYKISTLESAANAKYKLSAKVIDATAQSLYEKKLISYPRTDCEYISADTEAEHILNVVCPMYGIDRAKFKNTLDVLSDPYYTDAKKIAKEGHTGLIPTGVKPGSDLTKTEQQIYEMIARSFAAIFAPDKIIHSAKAVATDSVFGEEYEYQASEELDAGYELVLDPGYKLKTATVRKFTEGCELRPVEFRPKEVKTKPPVLYTDGTLVKALDNPDGFTDAQGKKVPYSIGTPATRSSILEDCISAGYFTRDKGGHISSTPFGEYVVDIYGGLIDLFDIRTTARWEELFRLIRENTLDARTAEMQFYAHLNKTIAKVMDAEIKPVPGTLVCPLCKTGKLIKSNKNASYFCSNYQNGCKFSVWMKDKRGFTLSDKDVKDLVSGNKIEKERLSKAGKPYKQPMFYNPSTNSVEFDFESFNRSR